MTAAWERNVAVNRNPSPDMFTFEDYDQNSPFAGVKSIEEKKD